MGNLTNREIDNIVKRVLKEAPIDYEGPERMDPSIERKILAKQTPYSNHPAMPKTVSYTHLTLPTKRIV